MLKITNLTKSFGSIRAVDNLSLTINQGEIYALIGPNGAGKTTTIKILAGLYWPNSGSIEFLEKNLLDDKLRERKLIGYIPDEPIFYSGLTGLEHLNLVAALYGVSEKKKHEILVQFYKIFPLQEVLGENPENYSRGNKQKLAICSAFLTEPKLLLVDEPIVGLDPQSAKAVLELFLKYAKDGGSILLSTHTLSVAEEIAKRVGILDHGILVAEGDLKYLRQKAKLKTAHLEEIFLKLTE